MVVGEAEVIVVPSVGDRLKEWFREKSAMMAEKSNFVIDTNSRLHWVTNGNCFLIFFTYITITYMVS